MSKNRRKGILFTGALLIIGVITCISIPIVKNVEAITKVEIEKIEPKREPLTVNPEPEEIVPKETKDQKQPKAEEKSTLTAEAVPTPEPIPILEEKETQQETTPVEETSSYGVQTEEDLAISMALTDVNGWGRLVIPDEGINVSVYPSGELNAAQAICDRQDSAVLMTWSAGTLIADHHNQGFDGIKNSIPGQTLAYIGRPNGTVDIYVCSDTFQGHNTNYGITDASYRYIEEDNPGGLIMYTCNESWQNITVVFWEPI